MKVNFLKDLFRLSFIMVFAITFIAGGFLQLFLGIPNTLLTYISVFIFSFFLFAYTIFSGKIILNKSVIFLFLFGILILTSGLINKSGLFKTALYMLYFLLPFATYLFFRINNQNNYMGEVLIKKMFFYIACIQLPIMILQKYTFPFLIKLNQSGQGIIDADIMFGSFFLKADHALGLFLLFNIFNIVVNNKKKEITKFPLLMFLYLGITILYSESNITKLILFVFVGYSIYKAVPKKVKIFGFFGSLAFIILFFGKVKEIDAVKGQIHFIKNEYNVERSFKNFERGIAKRPQVVISYFTKVPIKIVGNGPYSYFNILKGKFTNTQHFSQIIWTYADMGLIGIIIFVLILYALINSLGLSMQTTIIFFLIMIIYSFMTTIFSDLAIMITLLSVSQKRKAIA